ncbi:hypothetical protein [Nocardiopsis suaedae]|uniref:Uncharacterized protein n=1 Tax=Nocardiopsis suaedae TaxID=3018444 RepID=A0ABT4TVW5_9ACTN|nr:hypothetical protein [Nocardiopsis suaedae]MDA2808551.1 hypothetical protein [Nocardiopsis suaedae]
MSHQRSRALRTRSDAGAGFIEYAGVVLTIGAIVASVLATGFDRTSSTIVASIQDTICEAFSTLGLESDCDARQGAEEDEYEPDKCLVSQSTDIGGGSVSVLFVDVGQDYVYERREYSDGTVRITLFDADTAGVSTGVGASLDLGSVANLGADINLGAGVTVKNGSAWEFDSAEEAAELEDDLATFQKIDAGAKNTVGQVPVIGGWLRDKTTDIIAPDIPDPDITRTTVGVDAGVDGSLGAHFGKGHGDKGSWKKNDEDTPGNFDPNLGIEGAIHIQGAIGMERNHQTGETTTIYEAGGSADITANGSVVGKARAGAAHSGMIRVTEDENGNITNLVLIQTTDDGTGTAPQVIYTSVKAKTPEESAMVEEWMGMFAGDDVIPLTWDAADPTELSDNPTPFEEWVFENARTTRAQYDREDNTRKVGASVKLGVKLGLGGSWGGTEQDITEAEYLGAPNNGTREYVPYEDCMQSD